MNSAHTLAFPATPADDFTSGETELTCVPCAVIGALLGAIAVTVLLKQMVFAPPKALVLPLDPACSLSAGPCAVDLPDGGSLEFALGPRPTPLLKPLALDIRVAGSDARAMEVDFTGVDVPMAFNRADLAPSGEGSYAGQATLPLCANGRMEWRATVRLEDGGRQIYVPFRFTTERKTN